MDIYMSYFQDTQWTSTKFPIDYPYSLEGGNELNYKVKWRSSSASEIKQL